MEKAVKVYVLPPDIPSWAISRVMDALVKYAPPQLEFVSDMNKAQLIVLNVIGRRDMMMRATNRAIKRGQKYAVIQYVLKSTQKPDANEWLPLWVDAVVVWSYLDLKEAVKQDGASLTPWQFYHQPLGVDTEVFRMAKRPRRKNIILTAGSSMWVESIREIATAAKRVGRPMIHLGDMQPLGDHVKHYKDIDDAKLVELYNSCEFVSGLRRIEGFELCCAEGIICGSRPVMFDKPHYKWWFKNLAEFIPEGPRSEVIDNLEALFRRGTRPVLANEREWATFLFNWKSIIEGFWSRCL